MTPVFRDFKPSDAPAVAPPAPPKVAEISEARCPCCLQYVEIQNGRFITHDINAMMREVCNGSNESAKPYISGGFQEVQTSRETAPKISVESEEKIDALDEASSMWSTVIARKYPALENIAEAQRRHEAARLSLEQHIASLETKLAAASADTKRLDELERKKDEVWIGAVALSNSETQVILIAPSSKPFLSFREAADASLAASSRISATPPKKENQK